MKFRAGALQLVCVVFALIGCAPELDWRDLSVPQGRFAVLLPCKAAKEARALKTAAGELTMTMHACSIKQSTMGVAYIDYPAAALAANDRRARIDAARDALLRNIRGKAIAEQDLEIAGSTGRQVYALGGAGAQGALLKARFLLSGNRLYQIAYVGYRDDMATADIDMFLDSFKLLGVSRP